MKGKKLRKKCLPKVGLTRFGHASHVKGFQRFSRTKFSRKKLSEVLDFQCKKLQKELVYAEKSK